MSGAATVMIARWYWWRVNAWSEISAIVASLLIGNFLILYPPTAAEELFPLRILITSVSVTLIWIFVTLLTSRRPDSHVLNFYSSMKISGPGWRTIRALTGIEPINGEFRQAFTGWLVCVVFLYSILVGLGKLLLHEWMSGGVCIVLAIFTGYLLQGVIRKIRFD
jgi:SSS family solute:Na+ symporter